MRGDAEAMNIPERTEMADDATAFACFEPVPDCIALLPDRIDDRLPGKAGSVSSASLRTR